MLEFFFELFGEIFINLLFELGISRTLQIPRSAWWTFCMIIVGGLLGWASTAIWAKPLLPWTAARLVTILVVPVVVAYTMSVLATRRRARGGRPGVLDYWVDAYFFSLAFSVARFAATW